MNALASLSNTAGKSASNINSLSISSIFEIAIPFLGVLNPAKTVEKLMSQWPQTHGAHTCGVVATPIVYSIPYHPPCWTSTEGSCEIDWYPQYDKKKRQVCGQHLHHHLQHRPPLPWCLLWPCYDPHPPSVQGVNLMYQHFISSSKFKINICIANFSCPCYLSSQVATRSTLAFSFYLPFSSTTFSHGSLGGGLIISYLALIKLPRIYEIPKPTYVGGENMRKGNYQCSQGTLVIPLPRFVPRGKDIRWRNPGSRNTCPS